MRTPFAATARDRIDDLLRRQEAERAALVEQLEAEEAEAADRLRDAVRTDAGLRLAEAVAGIERQLRQDRRLSDLYVQEVTDLPAWANAALPVIGPGDRAEGRRAVAVYVARADTTGHRTPIALALFDCTDAVFGSGSRARRDCEAPEVREVAEPARAARRG